MAESTTANTVNYDAFKTKITFSQILGQIFKNRKLAITFKIVITIVLIIASFFTLVVLTVEDPAIAGYVTIMLVFVLLPIITLLSIVAQRFPKTKQQMFLQQFAQDNNFTLTPHLAVTDKPGVIFGEGRNRHFENLVTGEYQKLPFEFGNYLYTTGGGRSTQIHVYGVLRIALTRQLPHVLLDSKHNNTWKMSNLSTFRNQQKLQLEGNFNQYFELYVPEGYERDALYFITPELMLLLIDYGAKFDIELVDNYLYIYSSTPFKLDAAETAKGIFNLINLIGSEVQENITRYSDARVGSRAANIVAEPGRRLKKAIPWLGILIFIIYLVVIFYSVR